MTDSQKKKIATAALKGLANVDKKAHAKADATEGGKYDTNNCGADDMCLSIDC